LAALFFGTARLSLGVFAVSSENHQESKAQRISRNPTLPNYCGTCARGTDIRSAKREIARIDGKPRKRAGRIPFEINTYPCTRTSSSRNFARICSKVGDWIRNSG
jgi:hypothetical protein